MFHFSMMSTPYMALDWGECPIPLGGGAWVAAKNISLTTLCILVCKMKPIPTIKFVHPKAKNYSKNLG